ncbi:MAG: xanthine dehydrogenase family protein subunit M [SAR324 cluster bacterium]|nr:xanthine dehydrogenase family protein subunit M [SAR324 cluster bacterium]
MGSISKSYFRPDNLNSALEFLTPEVKVLSGGTDFFPERVGTDFAGKILDICSIPELKEIVETEKYWKIGATVTWSDIIQKILPSYFDGLKLAAREIGGVQIQNQGTIAGNICNASPAADAPPVLMTLDAMIEVSSSSETKNIPISDFILGNRKTCLDPAHLVTAILVPKLKNRTASHFFKLGARRYLVISIAMVSTVIEIDQGKIASARLSIGACSPVAKRISDLEKRLQGSSIENSWEEQVLPDDLAELSPIDDIRADAVYRKEAALIMLKRTIKETRMKFFS